MKKINTAQLISILGKEKSDEIFLDKEWIRRQAEDDEFDYSMVTKYDKYWDFYSGNSDDGQGNFVGSIGMHQKDIGSVEDNMIEPVKSVTGNFYIYSTGISSLNGCPEKVDGNFVCFSNKKLTSLEGCPKIVGNNFEVYENSLTSLEGCPTKINGNFDCGVNNLTSLEFGPTEVGKSYKCTHNKLKSLEYLPKIINKDLQVGYMNLTSLEGIPKIIKGGLYCQYNKIKDLDDLVGTQIGSFHGRDNLFNEDDVVKTPDGKTYQLKK